MRVIVLCAGYATRLYPLTENQPKPLLPIAERPILDHILEKVQGVSGVQEAIVVTNHKFAGHFQAWAGHAHYKWPVSVVDDQTLSNATRLGAIGDLHFVLTQKEIKQEDLLIIAGDNLFDFDLRHFINQAVRRRPHASIAVFDVRNRTLAKQYGLVMTAQDGLVTSFLEKPENPPTTLASCGIYWLPAELRDALDRYVAGGHNVDQPGHFMRWLAETDSLYAVPLTGHWYDIGDLTSYQRADELFREIQIKAERKTRS